MGDSTSLGIEPFAAHLTRAITHHLDSEWHFLVVLNINYNLIQFDSFSAVNLSMYNKKQVNCFVWLVMNMLAKQTGPNACTPACT